MTSKLSPVLLSLMLICLTIGCARATEYTIDYILQNGHTIQGVVTVRGTVANSRVVTPTPGSLIKGEYDLTDTKTSASIHVMTTIDPPPIGVERTVTATVNASETSILLYETGQTAAGGMPKYLYAVLGGLVLVAIVLIVLLLRKPKANVQNAPEIRPNESPLPVTPPPAPAPAIIEPRPSVIQPQPSITPGKICTRCNKSYSADAQWCEDAAKPSPPSRATSGAISTCAGCPRHA